MSWSNVPTAAADAASSGHHLAANLLHFVRLLRGLGFSVSAAQVSDMVEGLALIDLARRDDFYYATRPFLVRKPDQLELFDRAFQLFWLGREQWLLELGISHVRQPARLAQPSLRTAARAPSNDRLADRYLPPEEGDEAASEGTDFSATYSPWETLRRKDFAAMSEDELRLARQCIADLVLSLGQRQTRRRVRAHKRTCCLDLSETVRYSMKHQGEMVRLAWSRPRLKPRPLVLICDISGSMERYSRLFLHFMVAMGHSSKHVEAFVFGTRLTRITPALRHKDVDMALREVSSAVVDWSGGTRIGESLKTFNYRWSRRVLRNGAVAIIISDGWDRGDVELLRHEIARLHRSVHRLIWLNPLAGAPTYQPLVRGMQAVLPHLDDFLPLHNLESLAQVSRQLGSLRYRGP